MRGRAAVIVFGAAAAFLAAAPGASAYIYWANYGPGLGGSGTTINRSNLDAHGQKSGFITTPASSPASIVSDGTHLYWGNTTGGPPAIGRANVDGSGANDTFIPSAEAFGIAVTSSYIYWTDGSRYIGRANLNGTGVDPHFIDMSSSQAPFGLAASGSKLYVGRPGQMVTVPATKSATPSITPFANLANASTYPFSVSISNGYVYWAEVNLGGQSGSSSIAREATTGTGFNENYVPDLQEPTGVANDGSWVYWVDHTTGSIGRALDNGTSASDIQASFITDPGGPWGVAVDALIDPTGTTVSCTPTTVAQGNPSVCTATVSDSASSETPGGTVTFSGNASTFFPVATRAPSARLPVAEAHRARSERKRPRPGSSRSARPTRATPVTHPATARVSTASETRRCAAAAARAAAVAPRAVAARRLPAAEEPRAAVAPARRSSARCRS